MPHKTDKWEDTYCPECRFDVECDCPCDPCRSAQRQREARRRAELADRRVRREALSASRAASTEAAAMFRAAYGEAPFAVTATGAALHTWDCSSVIHKDESILLTSAQALQWLDDPAYALPSFHRPRSLCQACQPHPGRAA